MPGRLAVRIVRLYQRSLGRLLGGRCRFYPTCSEYAAQALEVNGLIVGGAQTVGRLARCGPWHPGGVDHVRSRRGRTREVRAHG